MVSAPLAMAQNPPPVPGFNCFFENPDGNLIYPCVSVITAHISFPANSLNQVYLHYPNTFLANSIPPANINPVAQGNFGNGYNIGDLVSAELQIPPGDSAIDVKLFYRGCNVNPSPFNFPANNQYLFFSCYGRGGNSSSPNITFSIQSPAAPLSLPVWSNVAVAALSSIPSLSVQPSSYILPNRQNYTDYDSVEYERSFDVVLHSASVDRFSLFISNESNVDELLLDLVDTTGSNMVSIPSPISPTGGLLFILDSIPISCIRPGIGNTRILTFRQRVRIICNDLAPDALVSAKIDCPGSCNDVVSNVIIMNGAPLMAVGEIRFVESKFMNADTLAANSICGSSFYWDLDFEFPDTIASRVYEIMIPVNTTEFSISSLSVISNNSVYTAIDPGFLQIPNNGNPNGTIIIKVDSAYAQSNQNWLGFNSVFQPNGSSGDTLSGVWINTNPVSGTPDSLSIRIHLERLSSSNSSCTNQPMLITPSQMSNLVKFKLSNSCGISSIVSDTINHVGSASFPSALINQMASNGNTSIPAPLPFDYQLIIPNVNPFDIYSGDSLQVSCSELSYWVELSSPNGGLDSVYISNLLLSMNNAPIPNFLPQSSSTGGFLFELPFDSISNLSFNSYRLSFEVLGINCPPAFDSLGNPITPSPTFGSYTYDLRVFVRCDNCTGNTDFSLSCSRENVSIHCPGPCNSFVGFNHGNGFPDLCRISYGWEDSTAFSNQAPPLDSLGVMAIYNSYGLDSIQASFQLNSVYPFDLFTYKAIGEVNPDPFQNINHRTLSLELNYPTQPLGDFFEFVKYTALFIVDTVGGDSILISSVPHPGAQLVPADFFSSTTMPPDTIAPITNAVAVNSRLLSWDADSLLSAGINIQQLSYKISISAVFRIKKPVPSIVPGAYGVDIQGQFVLLSYLNPNQAIYSYSCDPWSTPIQVLIPKVELMQYSVSTGSIALNNTNVGFLNHINPSVCRFGHAVGIKHSGGNGLFPDFEPEFRPLSSWPQTLPQNNIIMLSDFMPTSQNYILNGGTFENATQGEDLLPSLERQTGSNNLQGLLITMQKDCPNNSPNVSLPHLKINPYAYIHPQSHQMQTYPPQNLNDSLSTSLVIGNSGSSGSYYNISYLNLPGASMQYIPNTPFVYSFSADTPAYLPNVPCAFRISCSDTLIGLSLTASPSLPVQTAGWYLYPNGISSPINYQLEITNSGTNGCDTSAFVITFEWRVYCDSADLPDVNNSLPPPCLTQVVDKTFQRGQGHLNNLQVSNVVGSNGCDMEWTLNLQNPATEPALVLSEVMLNFSTGLIYKSGTWEVSNSGVPPDTVQALFSLNSGSIASNTLNGQIQIDTLLVPPGESLQYKLRFGLTEGFCTGDILPSGAIFGVNMSGQNLCGEGFDSISFLLPSTMNTALQQLVSHTPSCCIANPEVSVVHVCSDTADNGEILVYFPAATNGFTATLYSYNGCPGFPCSSTLSTTSDSLHLHSQNLSFSLDTGTYHLVVWDSLNGGYYEQDVVIRSNAFTLNLLPPYVAFCDSATFQLAAIPVPLDTNLVGSTLQINYSWALDGVNIPNSNTDSLIANLQGSYSVIATEANGCLASDTMIAEMNPTLWISGPLTACDDSAQYCLPSFIPTNGTFQYAWFFNGQQFQTTTANCITFPWANYNYLGGLIEVYVPDLACGTSSVVRLEILPCCDHPNMPKLSVSTLDSISFTNIPFTPPSAGSNQYLIANQTFELETTQNIFITTANLVFENCNILMDDAETIVMGQQSQYLELLSTNILGCSTRHNGLYADGAGKLIQIDRSNSGGDGMIQDANVAITLRNGARLKSISGNFDKNLMHIFAKRSHITIQEGNYLCSSSLLPPYSTLVLPNGLSLTVNMSTRTQVGIRLEDCNANSGFTLSGTPPPLNNGSLPDIRKIVLQNANQGVLVTGGGLIFQGNTLTDCGRGVDVWNKVNTGIGNQPGLHNADAECTIGGGLNSTDGNSFINCSTSIRTGGKLVPLTISRNKIESSALNFSMGIMVHHLKGRSFSIVNNSLTDCRIGIWSFNNGTNLSSGQQKLIMRNTITRGINSSPVITNGIRVEESTLSTGNSAISSVEIQGNRIRNYRHGITATNCSKVQLLNNSLVLNNDLAGIWNPMGALTDYINGIAIHNCPNSNILSNRVSSFATTPYTWASYLVSGFRVAASPGTSVCSNIAAESGTDTIANLPYEIGDPFEFHGNCAPSTFKLNTMNNSTARGLYMGGMPIGSAVNGTVIGDQGAIGVPHDNTWSNISGFHTDFNNVLASNNEFYMTYSTNGFNNNSQALGYVSGSPIITFSSFTTQGTVSCGGTPFIVSPNTEPRTLDILDDIALDSISELGGNDTSRYFGKEYLYNEVKNDSTLAANTVFTQFKDSIELTNVKPMEIIKKGLIFPLDSSFIDTLAINLAQIQPMNIIEENFKTLMVIVSINPELKDSVFTQRDFAELRRIAHLCPFTDGTSVYSARVILHNFEPDSNYLNHCEFAKRPDRSSSERYGYSESQFQDRYSISSISEITYRIIPNPNNGVFSIITPDGSQLEVIVHDSKGSIVYQGNLVPTNNACLIDFKTEPAGLYNCSIIKEGRRQSFRFIISR